MGLCGLLASAFTACKDDSYIEPQQAEIGGETGFLAFTIKSADTGGMTRATGDAWLDDDNKDYAEGEDDIQKIYANEDAIVENLQSNRAFFFKDGTYHSSSLLNLEQVTGSDASHEGDSNHTNAYPEKVYSTMVKRTSDRGEANWPNQVLIVLNGRPSKLNNLILKAQSDASFNLDGFLAYINDDYQPGVDKSEGETLGLYYNDTDKMYYFTMSNSVFYDAAGQPINATSFDPDVNMKPTSAKAAESPITVYVERVVAKVEVGFAGYDGHSGDPVYFSDSTEPLGFIYSFNSEFERDSHWGNEKKPIELKALISNWSINGVEYETYLFKNVEENDAWYTTNPFQGWNDNNHHRSYWAKDPHYEWGTGLEYPTQYRFGGSRPYETGGFLGDWAYGSETKEEENDVFKPGYHWALDYKAYNAIENRRKHKYCLENTFDPGAGTYSQMIMGTHIIVKSRLLTSDEATKAKEINVGSVTGKELTAKVEEELDKVVSDKYRYDNTYFDEETFINNQFGIIAALLSETVGTIPVNNKALWDTDTDAGAANYNIDQVNGGIWYLDNDGKYKRVTSDGTFSGGKCAKASDIFVVGPAYVKNGDGKVTIALGTKDSNGDITFGYGSQNVNLYYANENTEAIAGKAEVAAAEASSIMNQFTRNQLVSLIYGAANVADCFKNGRMYYVIPIEHYIAAGAGNDYVYKYENIQTGDYGVVRNHWYKFTVNVIEKPGIPVHDPDQPIVPNYDDEDRYLGLKVVIIPWHLVNNGNVTLGGN